MAMNGMKRNRLFLWLGFVMMLMTGCEPQTTQLKIVCTSDVHGNFFPYDFRTDSVAGGSLARVCSYLNEQRKVYGDNLIYVDNGDILQGQPTVYYYNTQAVGDQHLAAQVLNYLKCDVATLGNHDIEPGGATYQRYVQDCNFPILSGNIYFEDLDSPFLPPYIVKEYGGIKVAFLGLITPAIPYWLPKNLWRGIEFADMEVSARRWMQHLQENGQPDVVIGIFHSGLEGGIADGRCVENAVREVAERVPGFDAILFGHDHEAFDGKVVNVEGDTVLLVNPANNADKVATLDVVCVKSKEGVRVSLDAELVDMAPYAPDEQYMSHFAPQMEEVKSYVDRKVGVVAKEMDAREAYFGPSEYVDFIHRMQLDLTNAQVSFAAPLSYDMVIQAGEVSVRDMFNIYQYENQLYMMWLTGQEIKDYLEMSYGLWTNRMRHANDHLLLLEEKDGKMTLKNSYYNFDSAAGILYEVDVTRPVGERIYIKSMADGKPFELSRNYRVALNSYRGNGGGELLTKGAGIPQEVLAERLEYATNVDLRFHLLHYIEGRGTVTPERMDNWRFVPTRWTESAAQRDKDALFGKNSQ